jgi:hypothetical protein
VTQNIISWTYNLQIRAKNSGGTVLHTWQATNDGSTGTINQPIRCGPPTYEPVVVGEREALDWSQDVVYAGFRKHLKVYFASPIAYIRGATGTAPITQYLHLVLSDILTVGNYLELSLDGGTTWRKVNLLNSVDYFAVDGRNVRLGLDLEFATAAIYSSVPGVAAADW